MGSQILISVLLNLCSESVGVYQSGISIALVHLLLQWNIYLLFNSDIVNFAWKTDDGVGEERKKASWGKKSYLGPAGITSFSSQELSQHNKYDSFWLVVTTGCFYILFLWAFVVSDYFLLEIYKHLVLPLSSITFTANSQAVSHFCKYIYLFQILYSMK